MEIVLAILLVDLVALAIYAYVVWKDMRAQKDDDELHFDPWED